MSREVGLTVSTIFFFTYRIQLEHLVAVSGIVSQHICTLCVLWVHQLPPGDESQYYLLLFYTDDIHDIVDDLVAQCPCAADLISSNQMIL